MTHRMLGTLTISHRGVPIGHTSLLELELPDPPRVPLHLKALVPPISPFQIHGFEPLPGYQSVRAIVRRASEAAAKLGYLGPVSDPESDRRGREARAALETLCAELEFRDEAERLIPVEVSLFNEAESAGSPYFALGGEVEDATALVHARLRAKDVSDSDHRPPAI